MRDPSCHIPSNRRRNRVFSDAETQVQPKSNQLAYYLANANQKLGFSVSNCLVHRSGFANPDRAGRERAKYGSTMLIQTNQRLTCSGRTCNELHYYEPNDALNSYLCY